MCKVTSEAGSCLTSSVVRIVESPQNGSDEPVSMILMAPEDVTASTGSVVSFTVRVTDEVSDVKWLICGRVVTNSDRGILVSLSIVNIQKNNNNSKTFEARCVLESYLIRSEPPTMPFCFKHAVVFIINDIFGIKYHVVYILKAE